MFTIDINSNLAFLEYCLELKNGSWVTLAGNPDITSLDFKELDSYIKSLKEEILWIDFNSISSDYKRRNLQLDLLGHSNEPVLILKFLDDAENAIPLLYLIKLKAHLTPEDLFYGKDQKHLIESIIKLWINSLNNTMPIIETEKIDFKYIVVNQINKIDKLNDDLSNSDFLIYKSLHQLFSYILKDDLLADEKIAFSKETVEWFKNFKGGALALEKQIKDAFEISKALYPTQKEILIRDYYFMPEVEEPISIIKNTTLHNEIEKNKLEPSEVEKRPNFKQELPSQNTQSEKIVIKRDGISRLEKTTQLLDRYELAVQKLITGGIPVLGKNIAPACEPPISAPALTDSINKHKERIGLCLQQFPDKWPLLKSNYQVIRNILS